MNALAAATLDVSSRALPFHEEATVIVETTASETFAYLDDHRRLGSHMTESSWRMGGAHMEIALDEQQGQAVGSMIRLSGRVLGIKLYLDEVVTQRQPPIRKVWRTVGSPRLLVIGHYAMGFDVTDRSPGAQLRIFIDYELPSGGLPGRMVRPLAKMYARWCVDQMAKDASKSLRSGGSQSG